MWRSGCREKLSVAILSPSIVTLKSVQQNRRSKSAGLFRTESIFQSSLAGLPCDLALGGTGPFKSFRGAGQLAHFDGLLSPPGVGELGFDLSLRLLDRGECFLRSVMPGFTTCRRPTFNSK